MPAWPGRSRAERIAVAVTALVVALLSAVAPVPSPSAHPATPAVDTDSIRR